MSEVASIVERDFAKNHVGREYDLNHAKFVVQKYIDLGKKVFQRHNVLFFYEGKQDGLVEFHCMNGGSGADLTNCINESLHELAADFNSAVTYYDNPRINELVKYSHFPAKFTKIDGGIDKTYKLEFDLRSA